MHATSPVVLLLLQLALILALSRVMGWLFNFFRQPQVMGEMVAGIMLGPSVFGLLAPGLSQQIFPPASIGYLNILSQIGVIFFLFLIGLELDPKLLRNRGHTAVVISHVSIIAPFMLGTALTLYLYPRVFNDAPYMKFTSVALFMGAAMSITAFPVLARILTERNMHKTNIGAIAITCAAVDDVTAWCMLAFVVGIARADGLVPGIRTAVLAVVYVALMFLIIRPFLRRLERVRERQNRLSQTLVAIIFLLTLASALTTEWIGIHALFGAFLMGAIMPKGTRFVRALSEKLEDYTVIFLLPIFFAFTGLRTQIGLLDNADLWLDTLLIIAVACLGKFGGSTFAGRACGLSWADSSVIGILMNTRGLMELVILNIGLQEGVISPAVFAMMVIMALVTTALTTPVLWLLFPARLPSQANEPKAGADASRFTTLIPISLPESGPALLRLAAAVAPHTAAAQTAAQPAGLTAGDSFGILALHLRRPADHDAYRSGLDEEPLTNVTLAPLTPLLAEATKRKITVEPISFISRDVADDIAAVAEARRVDLVLMGVHKPVFSKSILGGTVHRVLEQCPTDVAILLDRGLDGDGSLRRILVPFMNTPHDRLAMELAARIARSSAAAVTVAHIVSPNASHPKFDATQAISDAFDEPAPKTPVEFRVIENDSPIDAILGVSTGFDLIVVGMNEEWGLESHVMGLRPERIAREAPGSLLMVRKNLTSTKP